MFRKKLMIIFVMTVLFIFSFASIAQATYVVNMQYDSESDQWSGTGSDSKIYCDFTQWPVHFKPLSTALRTNIEATINTSALRLSWTTVYDPSKLSFNGYDNYWGPSANCIIQTLGDGDKKLTILWPSSYSAGTAFHTIIDWKNQMPNGASYQWKEINYDYWCAIGQGDASQLGQFGPWAYGSYITLFSDSSAPHAPTPSKLENMKPKGDASSRKANCSVTFLDKDGKVLYQTTAAEISIRHTDIEKIIGWKF